MKACATPGGGVMFIPDELERTKSCVSYADLAKGEKAAAPIATIERPLTGKKSVKQAA